MPFVLIVNVCGVAADDWNVTSLNSFSPSNPGRIVAPVAELRVTDPPATQGPGALPLSLFVHAPVTVHVDVPKSMKLRPPDSGLIVTGPFTVIVEPCATRPLFCVALCAPTNNPPFDPPITME